MGDNAEFYLPKDDCANGAACPGEGVFIPQQVGNLELDALFVGSDADTQADLALAEVDTHPLSDEVIPVIYDGALLTLDGLMDCFARKYPERATLLSTLLETQGYEIVFEEEPSKKEAELEEWLSKYNAIIRDLRPRAMTNQNYSDIRDMEAHAAAKQRELDAMRHWHIADGKIYLNTRINRNIDTNNFFMGDDPDRITHFPTNAEGAAWLNAVMGDWMVRSGIPGARRDEEFSDHFSARVAGGALTIAFGAAEVIGGVALIAGSSGLGAVGGGAMSIAGFEAITQGIDMWRTPQESAHGTGWLGDGTFAMLNEFGSLDADDQDVFTRYWSFAMLGLSLGGSGVLGFAGKTVGATRMAGRGRDLDFIAATPERGLSAAEMAIVGVKNARFGNLTASYAALPSGRVAMNIKGVGRIVAPPWESVPRLRLRLNTAEDNARFSKNFDEATKGFASLKPMLTRDDATRIVEEAAEHLGLKDVWRYVDEVRVRDGSWEMGGRPVIDSGSSIFTIYEGKRIIALSPAQINDSGQAGKLFTAAHEIMHARVYHLLKLRSPLTLDEFTMQHFGRDPLSMDPKLRYATAYIREEAIVEGVAQRRVEKSMRQHGMKIDQDDLDYSRGYFDFHYDAVRFYKKYGDWPEKVKRAYED